MHSSHQASSSIDHLAEWLLAHCPFSTLTVLGLVVLDFAVTVPRVPVIVASVVAADVLLNLARRLRRRSGARRARAATA